MSRLLTSNKDRNDHWSMGHSTRIVE